VLDLTFGLRAGYNLSFPLALFLSVGGFFLLKRIRNLSLYDIGKHGAVEHDASLVHRDTPSGQKFAPIEVQEGLVSELIKDAKTGSEEGEGPEAGDRRTLMDASDVARARIRREKCSPTLDGMHAEIARGEMAIILGVWETRAGSNVGVPVEWMREWIGHERFPSGWKATHVQGLFDVIRRSKAIRTSMAQQKREQS
jgi:Peroxidase, family 2